MTRPEHIAPPAESLQIIDDAIRWSDPYLYGRRPRLARLRATLPNPSSAAVVVSAAFVCVLMAVIFANRFVF